MIGRLGRIFSRRKDDPGPRVFTPRKPTLGEWHVPPAVWRKYVQIEAAMDAGEIYRVHEIQKILSAGSFEVPSTVDEIPGCIERLRARQKQFERGL